MEKLVLTEQTDIWEKNNFEIIYLEAICKVELEMGWSFNYRAQVEFEILSQVISSLKFASSFFGAYILIDFILN